MHAILRPSMLAVVLTSSLSMAQADQVQAINDFESAGCLNKVVADHSRVKIVDEQPGQEGKVLQWAIGRKREWAAITFNGVPSDVRDYRKLQFRIRSAASISQPLDIRFENSSTNYLAFHLENITSSWKTVSIELPKMRARGKFNAKKVSGLALVFFDLGNATIFLDDLQLVKAKGGWKYTDKELVAHLFGKKRASRVKKIETKNFVIYTDSRAARGKFPSALEKTCAFVRKRLGGKQLKPKLPVYIFQRPSLYWDFCVRQGESMESAKLSMGHATGEYFATFYQSPKSAAVTHELTHSLFHRIYGPFGGSWFQEGAAVFIEDLHKKKSSAFTFSSRVRSGQFLPLKEFMQSNRLIDEHNARGGAKNAGSLYAQAGAFFEFLIRGPYSAKMKKGMRTLAQSSDDSSRVISLLEKTLGASLAEIEKEWLKWGAKPPKDKKR